MQASSTFLKILDLNLKDLNPASLVWVCVCARASLVQRKLTFAIRRLTSTTLTFEPNHSSPLARPCLTKDNPYRSTPALCLLSSEITAVPQKKGKKKDSQPTLFFFFVKIVPPLMWSICSSVVWAWTDVCLCLFFTSRQNYKIGNISRVCSSLMIAMGIAFSFRCPVWAQTKVIDAPCEQISVLCKTKQYRLLWIKLWCFVRGHTIFMYLYFCFSFTCVEIFPFFCSMILGFIFLFFFSVDFILDHFNCFYTLKLQKTNKKKCKWWTSMPHWTGSCQNPVKMTVKSVHEWFKVVCVGRVWELMWVNLCLWSQCYIFCQNWSDLLFYFVLEGWLSWWLSKVKALMLCKPI